MLVAVLAIVGFLVWAGWDRDGALEDNGAGGGGGAVAETRKASDFVGSRVCAECHPGIADTFARHPMARTMQPIGEVEPIETFGDGKDRFTAGERTYRIELRDGEVIHHEIMYDDDGEVLYDQAETVQFVIGAGVKGRGYVLQRGGLLFESPITWYSQASNWGLSPGYPPEEHYRFQRRLGDNCLACHSGRTAPASGEDRFLAEKPFHETAIGCERCHGPGGRHVALYRSSPKDRHDDSLVVNPASLADQQQDDVCNQCHLEGKIRVLKQGAEFSDFRPGELLGKTWTVYVAETPFDEEGRPLFTSHVEQMHSSRCFQESGQAMRCTSCHDPHRVPSSAESASFYKARCNSCHQKRGCSLPEAEQQRAPAAGSCIACHMPRVHSSDVAHTTQADHRVVRHVSETRPMEQMEQERAGRAWLPFEGMGKLLSREERLRADALARLRRADDTGDIRLLSRVRKQLQQVLARDASDTEIRGKLGYAWFRLGNLSAAKRELERSLQERPDFEPYLTFLGLIAYSGRDDSGGRYFRRLMVLNPDNGKVHGPFADMLAASGKLDEAIRVAERGLSRDPTVLELRRALARFYRTAGRVKEAEEQERILGQIRKRMQ